MNIYISAILGSHDYNSELDNALYYIFHTMQQWFHNNNKINCNKMIIKKLTF